MADPDLPDLKKFHVLRKSGGRPGGDDAGDASYGGLFQKTASCLHGILTRESMINVWIVSSECF
jgi:hypothetical protein